MSRFRKNIAIRRISEHSNKLLRLILCLMLLYLQFISTVPLLSAADEQSIRTKLDQAEESYYNGDTQQSITLVRQCLADSLISKESRIRAYKILARSYLALEDFAAAKENVLLLLNIDPAYQPTIEQESPRFVALVDEARAEYAVMNSRQPVPQKTGIKSWMLWGAGGAAVTAIIIIAATSSGGTDNNSTNQPLPAPPPLP